MPLPLAPIAGFALRYGAVAIATYAISRRVTQAHFDQRGEEAMNDVDEGLSVRRSGDQYNGTARFRRVVRFGTNGPGVEIDVTALGRVRLRKI
ncbi:MAG: hypothetical protein ACU0CA_14410 [Paracoccaceae bacterium]